jgi:hypothetical protein
MSFVENIPETIIYWIQKPIEKTVKGFLEIKNVYHPKNTEFRSERLK